MEETQIVRSVCDTNAEILTGIEKLHCPDGFECDVTFGNGTFWKGRDKPEHCFDITPLHDGVIEADSCNLPLEDQSLNNIVFDPPFLCYVSQGRDNEAASGKKAVMSKRFGGYWAYQELEDHYRGTLKEASRVLKKKGVIVVKCQDIIHNHKMHATHVNVCNWATEYGFRLLDLFVLTAKARMPLKAAPHGKQTQRHARVYHSYFLVFKLVR
jgi:tRNA G10  N-methylase Trm11